MGLGMLRRYHARPDAGVVTETAMAPQPEQEEDTRVAVAAEALQGASQRETDLAGRIEELEGQEHPNEEELEELRQQYLGVSQEVEQAKIHLEEVELTVKEENEAKEAAAEAERVKVEEEAAAKKAAADAEANRPAYEVAGLNRNSSKANWHAFALTNGQTEDTLKGLGRDDIAALFIPKA